MSETIQPTNPERLPEQVYYIGLQGRLALKNQDFLDPEKECAKNDVEPASFEDRNYNLFENASEKNRSEFWQKKVADKTVEDTFDAQLKVWSEGVVKYLNSNGQISLTLSPFLAHIGITKNAGKQFTNTQTTSLYHRYFKPNESGHTGVKRFVEDIVSSYQTNGAPDYAKVTQNIAEIERFANIFGRDEKDMVVQLILAETRLKTSAPEFLQTLTKTRHNNELQKDVMRIDDLLPEEKRILSRIIQTPSQPRRIEQETEQEDEQEENETTFDNEETQEKKELPIMKYKQEIQKLIQDNENVIIVGGTGSGKTTQIPQFIREIMEKGDQLIVTEPRQINTENLATTVAKESRVKLGEEIGFKHGDKESKPSDKRDTTFNTEGTLLNRLIKDPTLKGISYVMIDEVHVRSTDTEELLVFLKIAQKLRKDRGMPPLKLIVTSATVDKEELKTYFDGTVPYEVPGQMYEVTPHFETKELTHEQKVIRASEIVENLRGKRGTGLIAVATIKDLDEYAKIVQKNNPDAIIIKLHSGSSDEEKAESEKKAPKGKQRIIVATDFIQTGITVPDLKYVINTGEVNQSTIDRQSGLAYPDVIEQSKAEIDQWRGRAGRVQNGDMYHLYSEQNYNNRREYPKSEIQRSDLTKLVLHLKRRSVSDISQVKFLSKIDPDRVAFAEETLQKLGALQPDGRLSQIGKRMLELPGNHHSARMIIDAEQKGRGISQICTIAALSESRGLFTRGEDVKNVRLKHPESDFLTYLNIWNEFEANGQTQEWAEANGLNHSVLVKAINDRDKLLKRVHAGRDTQASDEDLMYSIFEGYKDRLMKFDPAKNSYTWERNNGINFKLFIDNKSSLARIRPQYIIAGGNSKIMQDRNGRLMRLNTVQKVKPEWI